jgi:hypothetical protein
MLKMMCILIVAYALLLDDKEAQALQTIRHAAQFTKCPEFLVFPPIPAGTTHCKTFKDRLFSAHIGGGRWAIIHGYGFEALECGHVGTVQYPYYFCEVLGFPSGERILKITEARPPKEWSLLDRLYGKLRQWKMEEYNGQPLKPRVGKGYAYGIRG